MEQYRENAKANGRGRDVCNIDTCEASHDTLIRKKVSTYEIRTRKVSFKNDT